MLGFHDPRATTTGRADPYSLGIDLAGSNTGRVAFLANGFPDSVAFLDAVAAAMQTRAPGLEPVFWNKGNASITAPAALLDEIEQRECVAVVAAYGH